MNRRIEVLLMMLMGIVILLMVANLALFVRMNQLQRQVIHSLAPFQRPTGLHQGAKAPFFPVSGYHFTRGSMPTGSSGVPPAELQNRDVP